MLKPTSRLKNCNSTGTELLGIKFDAFEGGEEHVFDTGKWIEHDDAAEESAGLASLARQNQVKNLFPFLLISPLLHRMPQMSPALINLFFL